VFSGECSFPQTPSLEDGIKCDIKCVWCDRFCMKYRMKYALFVAGVITIMSILVWIRETV